MSRNTPPRTRGLLVAALLIGAVLAGDADAAVLHLDSGRRIVGRIVARDADSVTALDKAPAGTTIWESEITKSSVVAVPFWPRPPVDPSQPIGKATAWAMK